MKLAVNRTVESQSVVDVRVRPPEGQPQTHQHQDDHHSAFRRRNPLPAGSVPEVKPSHGLLIGGIIVAVASVVATLGLILALPGAGKFVGSIGILGVGVAAYMTARGRGTTKGRDVR
jgi:hypothetical protein